MTMKIYLRETQAQTGAQSVLEWLCIGTLILSWLSSVVMLETSIPTMTIYGKIALISNKPILQYLLYALSLFCLLAAGGIGLHKCLARKEAHSLQLAYFCLFLTAGIWTLIGFTPDEIFSKSILIHTGPFPWLACILVFAGYQLQRWDRVHMTLLAMSIATICLGFRSMVIWQETEINPLGISKHLYYGIFVFWLGGLSYVLAPEQKGFRFYLYRAPLWVAFILFLASQKRSLIIDSILLIMLASFMEIRGQSGSRGIFLEKMMKAFGKISISIIVLVIIALCTISHDALEKLYERRFEDTRSGQFVIFFEQIAPESLILGNGPKASYRFGFDQEYQSLDNGYLWLLFIGGLPVLLPYLYMVVYPGCRCLFRKLSAFDSGGAILLFIWALAIGGLSVFCVPSLFVYHYVILLLAGKCHRALHTREVPLKLFRIVPEAAQATRSTPSLQTDPLIGIPPESEFQNGL